MFRSLWEKLGPFIGGILSVAIPALVVIVSVLTSIATDINLGNSEKIIIGASIGLFVGGIISYYVIKRIWPKDM